MCPRLASSLLRSAACNQIVPAAVAGRGVHCAPGLSTQSPPSDRQHLSSLHATRTHRQRLTNTVVGFHSFPDLGAGEYGGGVRHDA
jgi:hypothetical protein